MKKTLLFNYFILICLIISAQNGWRPLESGTSHSLGSVFFIGNIGYTIGGNGQTNGNVVLKTTDGGSNWSSSITTNQFYDIFFTDINTGYAVDYYGILKTINGGTSWFRVFDNQGLSIYSNLSSIFFADINTGYCVGGISSHYGTIMKTIDGGANWFRQESGVSFALTSVYFTDINIGYAVGNSDTILKTNDGGENWLPIKVDAKLLYSIFFIGNTGYTVGVEGTILKTIDGGTSWTKLTSGTDNVLSSVYFINPDTGYVVGGKNTYSHGYPEPLEQTILKTCNGGVNWIKQTSGTIEHLYSVYFTDANTGYAVGQNGVIIKTVTGGDYAKISFPNSSDKPIWSESSWHENWETNEIEYSYTRYSLLGDTIINDKVYNKLYSIHDSVLTVNEAKYIGGLREDSLSRIWLQIPTTDKLLNNNERLLYDFSKGLNDTIWYNDPDAYFGIDYVIIESIDSIEMFNGEKRKSLYINGNNGSGTWIEGIGSPTGLLRPAELMTDCKRKSPNNVLCGAQGSALLCYYQNNSLIYTICNGSCFPSQTSLGNQKFEGELIEIYPNPAQDFFQIKYEFGRLVKIELYSSIGHLIKTIQLDNKSLIDISELEYGFYIAKVYTDKDKIVTVKVIKY